MEKQMNNTYLLVWFCVFIVGHSIAPKNFTIFLSSNMLTMTATLSLDKNMTQKDFLIKKSYLQLCIRKSLLF